jgi:hypothetical protein
MDSIYASTPGSRHINAGGLSGCLIFECVSLLKEKKEEKKQKKRQIKKETPFALLRKDIGTSNVIYTRSVLQHNSFRDQYQTNIFGFRAQLEDRVRTVLQACWYDQPLPNGQRALWLQWMLALFLPALFAH